MYSLSVRDGVYAGVYDAKVDFSLFNQDQEIGDLPEEVYK